MEFPQLYVNIYNKYISIVIKKKKNTVTLLLKFTIVNFFLGVRVLILRKLLRIKKSVGGKLQGVDIHLCTN